MDEGVLREAATLLDADAATQRNSDSIDFEVGRLSKKPMVREGVLEPPHLAAPDPMTYSIGYGGLCQARTGSKFKGFSVQDYDAF